MNEVMLALEAMIRRIVNEELTDPSKDMFQAGNFRAMLKDYVDANTPEWAALVSQGALDKPWFDEAVKAEAITAAEAIKTETPQLGVQFPTQIDFERSVRHAVIGDAYIHDHIVDIVGSAQSDVRRDYVQEIIGDYDFSDIVKDCVNDMSFSVSVD
jgi:hypothetical protein